MRQRTGSPFVPKWSTIPGSRQIPSRCGPSHCGQSSAQAACIVKIAARAHTPTHPRQTERGELMALPTRPLSARRGKAENGSDAVRRLKNWLKIGTSGRLGEMAAIAEKQAKRWTYEEYYKLGDDQRYEVIEGKLISMSPAPGTWHQHWVFEISGRLF